MSTPTPNTFYYLTNPQLNSSAPPLQLTSNDGSLTVAAAGNESNHQWYLTPITGYASFYRLHTVANGDAKALDVQNDHGVDSMNVWFVDTGAYTGQFWRIDSWGDGTWKLSNNSTGLGKLLQADANTLGPFLGTADDAGQHWVFNKVEESTTSSSLGISSSSSSVSSHSVVPSSSTVSQDHNHSTGVIVGSVIGGLIVLTLCVCAVIFCLRSKKIGSAASSGQVGSSSPTDPATTKKNMAFTAHEAVDEDGGRVGVQEYPAEVEARAYCAQGPVEMPTQRF